MTSPFPNVYTHRKVAETAAKLCDICKRATSTSVLITPEPDAKKQETTRDFFYVCADHLTDITFCSPIVDKAAAEAKAKKAMEEEMERVKKEYEEKQKKKKEKEKEEKDKKDADSKDTDSKKKDDESKSDKKDGTSSDEPAEPAKEEPRVFELHSIFYGQRKSLHDKRIAMKKQAEVAKLNRERLQDPNFFPSVPKGFR